MEKCDYLKCIFLKARNDSLLYWTTFARHGDRFWKPSKSSLHLVLGLPRFLICPRRVLNVMLIVQRLSVLLAKQPAQFHLSLLIISMISDTLVSSRIQWAVLRSRHDSLMRSLHSSEFQDLLFRKILACEQALCLGKNSEEREGKVGERACRQTFAAAIAPSCNYPAAHLSVRSLSVNQFPLE